jgi:hypothetical protein
MSSRRFELTKPALALDAVVRQGWITIPAGEVIRTLGGPDGDEDEMVDVIWDGRMLAMLAIDVASGGKEVPGQG